MAMNATRSRSLLCVLAWVLAACAADPKPDGTPAAGGGAGHSAAGSGGAHAGAGGSSGQAGDGAAANGGAGGGTVYGGAGSSASGALDPECTPKTCLQLGALCGAVSDGCGGVLRCGTCKTGELCDAATHRCAAISDACEKAGKTCGVLLDACGGATPCGTCEGGAICDAASGQCGACKPRS